MGRSIAKLRLFVKGISRNRTQGTQGNELVGEGRQSYRVGGGENLKYGMAEAGVYFGGSEIVLTNHIIFQPAIDNPQSNANILALGALHIR